MNRRKEKIPIYRRSESSLTKKQKLLRERSLVVLSQSRKTGKSPTRIARQIGISFRTVQNHTHAFKKVNAKLIPKKFDKIQRTMLTAENGKLRSITVSDSRHARTIEMYHNAVKQYLNTSNTSKLKKFTKKRIRY